MARRAAAVTLLPMPDTVHLVVDLQVGRESISGSAEGPTGAPSSFDGWLGLISIVERIRANLGGPEASGVDAPDSSPDDHTDRHTNQEGNRHDH
jgi:hypothetical protein